MAIERGQNWDCIDIRDGDRWDGGNCAVNGLAGYTGLGGVSRCGTERVSIILLLGRGEGRVKELRGEELTGLLVLRLEIVCCLAEHC